MLQAGAAASGADPGRLPLQQGVRRAVQAPARQGGVQLQEDRVRLPAGAPGHAEQGAPPPAPLGQRCAQAPHLQRTLTWAARQAQAQAQAQAQEGPVVLFVQRGDDNARHFLNMDATRGRMQQEFGLRTRCAPGAAWPRLP